MIEHADHCPDKGDRRCDCDWEARVRADERRRELLAVCECGCMERDAHAEQVAAKLVEVICEQAEELDEESDRRGVWSFITLSCGHRFALGDYPHGCPICEATASRDAARARTVEAEQKVIDAHREVTLARAEVERITEDNRILREDAARNADMAQAWMEQRDAARAEVARLEARWLARTPSYAALRDRREVLADLRAKVEGLPYRTWVPPHATDCPGRPGKRGICTCGDSLRASDWMLRADVLALLEEAQS